MFRLLKKGQVITVDGCSYTINSDTRINYSFDPQIGDTVWWVKEFGSLRNNCGCLYAGSTLIHIHQIDQRKFAVVAFMGDRPTSVWWETLRESHAACAD